MTPPPLDHDGHEIYLTLSNGSCLVLPISDWLTLIEAYAKLPHDSSGLWFMCVNKTDGFDASLEIFTRNPGIDNCYHLPPDRGVFWISRAISIVRTHTNDRLRLAESKLLSRTLCSTTPSS